LQNVATTIMIAMKVHVLRCRLNKIV